MRMAGIPARIVTGYQGGEFNPLGDYFIVRQADAHAWVEIWLAGQGWVRIDPTAAVAPQRVEAGLNAALPATEIAAGLVRINSSWLHQARLAWDSLNNGWNQWVLAYGPQRQQDLFQRLGLGGASWQWLTAGLVTLCGGLLLSFALFMLREEQRKSKDRVLELYRIFCGKLKPLGLVRKPYEGPLDFAARVIVSHPELADRVNTITRLYVDLRYGRKPPAAQFRHLKQRIQSFQPV
jgi:hypothetical protein